MPPPTDDAAPRCMAVTGVGGFIGLALARRALADGWRVRGLEIDRLAAARARGLGVDVVRGSVTDRDAVTAAVRGADVVVNTAAVVHESGEPAVFRAVNVEGAHLVASAAIDAGAGVFVQLSSIMVHGFDYPPDVAEDGPLRGDDNPYCETKIAGEALLAPLDRPGFRVVIVRPGDVYGPGSVPWVDRPVDLMRRRLFALPDGGEGVLNLVHVDDLVDGVMLAVEHADDVGGRPVTVTGGEAVSTRDYFGRLAAHVGAPRPPVVPAPVLRAFATAVAAIARRLGRDAPIDAEGVRFLQRPHRISIRRARDVLGYEPRVTLDDGIAGLPRH